LVFPTILFQPTGVTFKRSLDIKGSSVDRPPQSDGSSTQKLLHEAPGTEGNLVVLASRTFLLIMKD
jgi:hypothetical protein